MPDLALASASVLFFLTALLLFGSWRLLKETQKLLLRAERLLNKPQQ